MKPLVLKRENRVGAGFLVCVFLSVATSVLFSYCTLLLLKSSGLGSSYPILFKGVLLLAACQLFFSVAAAFFKRYDLYKTVTVVFLVASVGMLVFSFLKSSDVTKRFSSPEQLTAFVRSKGAFAAAFLFLLTLLGVVALPLPSIVGFTAGVAVFGAPAGGFICFAGIFCGSLIAFWIGRRAGTKFVSFLIGKKTMDGYLKKLKGKDKYFLTFAFLFPFFPDDALCFVAGLSSMSFKYFFFTSLVTRAVSSAFSAMAVGGMLLPFDSWWGIVSWVVLALIVGLITLFAARNEERIKGIFLTLKRVFHERVLKSRLKRSKKSD